MESLVTPGLAAWLARPDARVALVGASGWIGMALVHVLLDASPELGAPKLRLFGSARRTIEVQGRTLEVEPLVGAADLGAGDWLVLHAAIVGPDRVAGGDAAEVRVTNDRLLAQVLDLADGVEAQRLVFFSSGAAQRTGFGSPAKQVYARMKAEHEDVTAAWAGERGRGLIMPRVFNLGGPYINHVGAYALGDFIQAARRDGRIAIGTASPVFRSYVHVREMAAVVLEAAVKPMFGAGPFDVAGAEIVELGALARMVGAALGMADIVVERPSGDGEADWYVGDGRAYQSALFAMGRAPVPLTRIVADTAAYLRVENPT